MDDIWLAIDAETMWLYGGEKCALLLEIAENPNWRALSVFLAGGDLTEIKSMLPVLERVAREHGCKKIGLTGRLGWVRSLRDLGFVHTAAVAEKEL